MEKQRHGQLLSRTCRNHQNSCCFSPGDQNFCRQNGPRFGVQKRTPKWRPLVQSQFDLLVSGQLGPRFGVRFWTPKRGPFVGKIFAAGRKIVQVSIVSAGTRQKFCIPLRHWVPMVLQRREQLFSTLRTFMPAHVLELSLPLTSHSVHDIVLLSHRVLSSFLPSSFLRLFLRSYQSFVSVRSTTLISHSLTFSTRNFFAPPFDLPHTSIVSTLRRSLLQNQR